MSPDWRCILALIHHYKDEESPGSVDYCSYSGQRLRGGISFHEKTKDACNGTVILLGSFSFHMCFTFKKTEQREQLRMRQGEDQIIPYKSTGMEGYQES